MNIYNTYKGILLAIGLVCLCFLNIKGQYITNGDFEDTPKEGIPPIGWSKCFGWTPDTQPGFFCITIPAISGNTYISIAATGYGIGETVSQILNKSLKKDSVYFIKNNSTQFTNTCNAPFSQLGYTHLNFYFGNTTCDYHFLAYQSPELTNYNIWTEYCTIFKPINNYTRMAIAPYSSVPGLRIVILDNLDLAKAEDRLSYTLTGSNASICASESVSLTLTGLPTCLGAGFAVAPNAAQLSLLTPHVSLFTSTIAGIYTISGFAQSGTVTSWPVYHVVSVSGCVPNVPTITGLNTICSNQITTYHVSTQLGVNYLWSCTGCNPSTGSGASFTTSLVPLPLGEGLGVGLLTVAATNLYGTVSAFKTITVLDCSPPLIPTITGLNTICQNSVVSFQVSTQAGVSLNPQGFQNLVGFTATGIYTLTATAINFYGTVSGFKTITVLDCSPPQIPTIVGVNTICSNLITTYQATTQLGVSYTWSCTGCNPSTGSGASFTTSLVPLPLGEGLGVGLLSATATNPYGTVSGFKTITVSSCVVPLVTCAGGCPANTSCTGTVCSPIVVTPIQTCLGQNCSKSTTCSGSNCINCFGIVCTVVSTVPCQGLCLATETCVSGLCISKPIAPPNNPTNPCTFVGDLAKFSFEIGSDTLYLYSQSRSTNSHFWRVAGIDFSQVLSLKIPKNTLRIFNKDSVEVRLLVATNPTSTCFDTLYKTIPLQLPLSLATEPAIEVIRIFPNPTTGEVNITAMEAGLLIFYAPTGQEVARIKIIETTSFDLSYLQHGLYLYQYQTKRNVVVGKLVLD